MRPPKPRDVCLTETQVTNLVFQQDSGCFYVAEGAGHAGQCTKSDHVAKAAASANKLAVRQRLLESNNASGGHLRHLQSQLMQGCHSAQVS